MKNNETPEILLAKVYHSIKLRKLTILLVCAGILICIIPLLPPVQNALFSFIDANFFRSGSGGSVEHHRLRSLLSLSFFGLLVFIFALCCIFSKAIAGFLENTKNQRLIIVVAAGMCTLVIGYISVLSYQHGWRWLNSDHSSEMVLGKLLAEENAFISRNWYYSTEIRLIYQTIFTMPLFKLLGHYENWALIRAINIFLNNLVLVLSYLFLARQMKVQLKWVCITGIFLIMPISYSYWDIVIFGGYYIFFIAQLFCCLGLFMKLAYNTNSTKAVLIDFIMFTALSFALGVQGIRSLLCVHIPLLITCIYLFSDTLKQKKFPLFLGCYGLVICCAGFAVNVILHFWYSFYSYEGMKLTNLYAELFSKLGQSLVSLAEFFGFSAGNSLLSFHGLFSVIAIIVTFILFWTVQKTLKGENSQLNIMAEPEKYKFMPLFFLVSVIINIFVFNIVFDSIIQRYFIPFMVLYVPLIAILFEYAEKAYSHLKRIALISGIALFVFGQGCLYLQNSIGLNENIARNGYIKYLLDNYLYYGFATFWNANVTTELSNGKIELVGLIPDYEWEEKELQLHNWLTMKKYFNPSWYSGESFLLLTRTEWELVQVTGRPFTRLQPDYKDSGFIIIRYPSAEIIHREVLDNK